MGIEPEFTTTERDVLYKVIQARRDMRHFVPGETVAEEVLARILQAAHNAPSVGLMQPWRFIRIRDGAVRAKLGREVERVRLDTAAALGERGKAFLKLKVEGTQECAILLAMVMAPDDGTLVGRLTMPREMAIASCACAVQNMWLAARAENLGLGWVSFFDPDTVGRLLGCPPGAETLALLCLGPVAEFPPKPLLEIVGWRDGKSLAAVTYDDCYGQEPVNPIPADRLP